MKTKYHIILNLTFLCFFIISCNNQKNETVIKEAKNNKTLDKKRIVLYQSIYTHEYIANDTLFKLTESNDMYTEITKPINNNFEIHSVYDKKNLKLKCEGYFFGKMEIGIHKFYDEKGNFIKEINYDKDFDFTLDDLIIKVKREFKIDLKKDLKKIEIRRGTNTFNFPFYNVSIPLINTNSSYPKFRNIVLDGTFGFITSDKTYIITED
ncbi:MAG: hypothetical protein V4572_01525 [Bacteroidota bacterium]